jgi:polygalacturonase
MHTQLIGVMHLMYFATDYSCSTANNATIPEYQDIVVDGLTAANSQSGAYSEFEGYDENHILGIYLAHVHLDSTAQQSTQYANVGLDDSNITPSGPGVTTFNFDLP